MGISDRTGSNEGRHGFSRPAHAPARRRSQGPIGPFKPKWEPRPRTESKAPAAGTFKPKWESRARTDSKPPAAGSFRPKWEAKPKWEGKPNREARPARTFDNSTVGDYKPKWAAKQDSRPVSDARPARRNSDRPADFGPGPRARKDPPWKNGPGMTADTRKPSWKGASSASSSRPALNGSSKKKVILKPAPRRNPGEAVFPWQGSGMSKLKRQA